jgi:Mg2+-importing ATPase
MRTRRPFFRSRPGTLLLALTVVLIVVTLMIPYLPLTAVFGFVPISAPLLGTIVLIMLLYVAATEVQKRWFYRIVQ